MTQHPLVKFGDVVRQVKDKVDPQTAGLDRYVAGEHMDTDNLHIRRWGDVGAGYLGPAFHMRFQPGQILYGSRRTYLRKIAVADFEGITANTTYVIEPKDPEVLLPDFLPFVMSTERFHEHSIKQSKGSVNPYINFSDITWYEFPLPPVDEQRRIADLLWAADDVISSYQELLEKQLELQFILMSDLLSAKRWNKKSKSTRFGQIPEDWDIQKISEIAQVDYGISESVASNTDPSIGWSILTGANITLDGTIDLFKMNYIKPPTKESFILKKGDILLNWRSGSPEHVGKAAIFDLDGDYTYASFILRIRVGESMNNVFLHRLLNFMRKNKLFGSSTSQQINFKMNASQFREVEVVVPPIDEQLGIVEIFKNWKNATDALEAHIESSKQVKQNLLNKFLA